MKFPYAQIQLEKDGAIHDQAELDDAIAMISREHATDVLVLVHGWNNDMNAARQLYETLIDNVAGVRAAVPAAAHATIAVVGILWPSIAWGDPEAVAGGGAGLADPQAELVAEIQARIEDPATAAKLADLVPKLDLSADARAEYLIALRSLLPPPPGKDEDPPPPTFVEGNPDEVFARADVTEDGLAGDDLIGGAQDVPNPLVADLVDGGAAGFGFGDILTAARNLLNLTTYYTMKDRSGTVGRNGIAQALESIRQSSPARLHLVGHSFGARAATQAVAVTGADVSSLSLLQGAFSHFGMATNWDGKGDDGLFRIAPTRLKGPLLVTFTRKDVAVGLAYAIASRIANQVAAGVGGPDDPYGGIGSNGALKTDNSDAGTLLDLSGTYTFTPNRVVNLDADDFITGHSDVTGRQVAYAVLSAIGSGITGTTPSTGPTLP